MEKNVEALVAQGRYVLVLKDNHDHYLGDFKSMAEANKWARKNKDAIDFPGFDNLIVRYQKKAKRKPVRVAVGLNSTITATMAEKGVQMSLKVQDDHLAQSTAFLVPWGGFIDIVAEFPPDVYNEFLSAVATQRRRKRK